MTTNSTTTERVSRVGVVGGGRMGSGIAQTFAAAGHTVVVVEQDRAAGDAALATIRAALARAEALGRLAEPAEAAQGRVTAVVSPLDLPGDLDLVIEAVPEIATLKTEVLQAAEGAVGPDGIIASNTSSLSITALSKNLRHPERFVGMHFFNPVPSSALVEIVTGEATADAVPARVVDWVDGLGKQSIVVRDSPGFATSRLGVLLGMEAIRMVEEGVADAESIDRAMELGYRHPMGPLRSTDLVGLDVRLAIADHLAETLGPRFAPPQMLREKVARGELGRKSGQGFYTW